MLNLCLTVLCPRLRRGWRTYCSWWVSCQHQHSFMCSNLWAVGWVVNSLAYIHIWDNWKKLELSETLTIAPLHRFSCCENAKFWRYWAKTNILTSIKGQTSVTNKQNMTGNNPNLDLDNINAYKEFGEILSICFKDIERKRNSDINQGP